MIRDANKENSHKHYKELEKMKDGMSKNKYFKDDLFKELGIPKFDKNEELKLNVPEDDEEFEKLEEDRKRKAEKLSNYTKFAGLANAAQTGKPRQRLKGKQRWAIIARSVYEFVHLLRMIRNKESMKRDDYISNFKEGLMLYIDVGKAWILK
jgi:hypothetical protein